MLLSYFNYKAWKSPDHQIIKPFEIVPLALSVTEKSGFDERVRLYN